MSNRGHVASLARSRYISGLVAAMRHATFIWEVYPLTATRNEKLISAVVAISLAAFVYSCDGDGSGGFAPPGESPAGIYTGSFITGVDGAPETVQVTGVISENLDAHFLVDGSVSHVAGRVSVSQTKLSAQLIGYLGEADRFFGIDGMETITLDGHVTAQRVINGDFSVADTEGKFNLNYDPLFEETSSLDLLQGLWIFVGGVYTITLDVDDAGQAFGTDSKGCVFDGQIGIIDVNYNAYQVGVVITNCGVQNGDYGGLVYLSTAGDPALNSLTVSVSNDTFAYSVVLRKM